MLTLCVPDFAPALISAVLARETSLLVPFAVRETPPELVLIVDAIVVVPVDVVLRLPAVIVPLVWLIVPSTVSVTAWPGTFRLPTIARPGSSAIDSGPEALILPSVPI